MVLSASVDEHAFALEEAEEALDAPKAARASERELDASSRRLAMKARISAPRSSRGIANVTAPPVWSLRKLEELAEVAAIGLERFRRQPPHRPEIPLPGGKLGLEKIIGGEGGVGHGERVAAGG